MFARAFSLFPAACLLLLAATPQVGDAQPAREKATWNYDGGVQLVTDGAIVNGPCFRLTGRLKAPQFFDNLRRVDSSTGTLFRRGNEIVTEFPERMELSFELVRLAVQRQTRGSGNHAHLSQQGHPAHTACEFLLEARPRRSSRAGN